MNIPDIDFTRIRSIGPAGQRGGFEQFICQQVAQVSPATDAKFVSLHGDGGDGGVECYWTLPDGDEHGWQAKYWTDHKNVDKTQLDKSVKAALEQHPKLTKYTIAIPTDPTGRTARTGKSLLEKIHDPGGWLEGWRTMTTDDGRSVEFEIEIEWETNIVDRLNRLDTSGTQRRYWFDVDVLSNQWWEDRKQDAVDAARPRYMPELNIDVPAARSIAALCSDDEWWQLVLDQADQTTKAVEKLDYATDEVIAADLNEARAAAESATGAITAWHSSRTAAGLGDVEQSLKDASAVVARQEAREAQALTDAHGDWDSQSWRQYQSEYMVRFPAAAVDYLRELGQKLDFGFVIECVAHLVEEGDEGEVFVEVEFDRLQAPVRWVLRSPDDVLVDEQFGVCAAELSAAGPTPFLPLFVGEDDQAFLVVLADQHVDLPLDLAWWQDGQCQIRRPL
ncbi:hypothetical protein C6369_000520 [Rhodococcus rhodochrous]|nr:hypothetical protein C6369_000520 [Rhodococcus rhodochrous]